MPLQFVAQGPMLIPAVVSGNVDVLDTVPMVGFVGQNFTDPSDFSATISAGTNTALIVALEGTGAVPTAVTWDPTGFNESLTKLAENTISQYFAVYARLNPTPGASKIIRVSGQGGAGRISIIAQTFKNVLQTAAPYTGTFTDIGNSAQGPTSHLTDTVTSTNGSAVFLMVQRAETVPIGPYVADDIQISQGQDGSAGLLLAEYKLATTTSTTVGVTVSTNGFINYIDFNIEKA